MFQQPEKTEEIFVMQEGVFVMAKGGTSCLFRKLEQTICQHVVSASWLHVNRKAVPDAPFWPREAGCRTEPRSAGQRLGVGLSPSEPM